MWCGREWLAWYESRVSDLAQVGFRCRSGCSVTPWAGFFGLSTGKVFDLQSSVLA